MVSIFSEVVAIFLMRSLKNKTVISQMSVYSKKLVILIWNSLVSFSFKTDIWCEIGDTHSFTLKIVWLVFIGTPFFAFLILCRFTNVNIFSGNSYNILCVNDYSSFKFKYS